VDVEEPAEEPSNLWCSSFESGFPGTEGWYDGHADDYYPGGSIPTGAAHGWTIATRAQFQGVFSGEHSYKGVVNRAGQESHRPYPVLHTNVSSPLVNSFMVRLDTQPTGSRDDWIQLGTWANNSDWGDVLVLNWLGDGSFWPEHDDYDSRNWSVPETARVFPLGRWVRITVYIYFRPNGDGTFAIWQDGRLMVRSKWTRRNGQALLRAHWGLYASSSISAATMYNDDIQIWTLSTPLENFSSEPPSPYLSNCQGK
jgi:hypothetical protein